MSKREERTAANMGGEYSYRPSFQMKQIVWLVLNLIFLTENSTSFPILIGTRKAVLPKSFFFSAKDFVTESPHRDRIFSNFSIDPEVTASKNVVCWSSFIL